VRDDVDSATCTASGYGGSASSGHMTPYDRSSVMHYRFSACGIVGGARRSAGAHRDSGWYGVPSAAGASLRRRWNASSSRVIT
jgi:hypothetical protein